MVTMSQNMDAKKPLNNMLCLNEKLSSHQCKLGGIFDESSDFSSLFLQGVILYPRVE